MTDSGKSDSTPFASILDPTWMVQSLFVETNFEARSHQEMIKMIDSADHAKTRKLGDELIAAATEMESIGNELSIRAPRVNWEGEGATAFTEWNASMSSATLRLAGFSRSAGESMQGAAETIQEVQRDMPPYSEASRLTLNNFIMQNPGGLAKLDGSTPSPSPSGTRPGGPTGPTPAEATAAQQQLEADHGEAVRQMRKLGTSYTMTGMKMNSAERPTFPPMPGELMPPPSAYVDGTSATGLSNGNTAASSGSTSNRDVATGSLRRADSPDENLATGYLRRVDDSSMTLDGGVALPEAPHISPSQHSSPGPGGSAGPSGPGAGPIGSGGTRSPTQRVVGQGGQTPPGKGGSFRPPAVGSGSQPGGTAPRGGSRLPTGHGNGIYGGRPTQSGVGQPTHGLPRSNAIGADPAQNQHGRPPMGRGMSGGFGGGGGGASSSGVAGGRPLATTPGGRVGKPSSSSVVGGRPFTPGGSGLVRGGNESTSHGAMGRPATSNAPPGEERRTNSQRPDYLVEDEETWQTTNSAGIAPPVVE